MDMTDVTSNGEKASCSLAGTSTKAEAKATLADAGRPTWHKKSRTLIDINDHVTSVQRGSLKGFSSYTAPTYGGDALSTSNQLRFRRPVRLRQPVTPFALFRCLTARLFPRLRGSLFRNFVGLPSGFLFPLRNLLFSNSFWLAFFLS